MAATPEGTERLQAGLAAHERALRDFIASAQKIQSSAWNLPMHAGKWSPAQVAEHLRLSYTTVRAELSGHGGFRVRTTWWRQRLLRVLYLSRILKSGRFPKGVPATREVRPAGGPFDRQQLLLALRQEGEQFVQEVRLASDRATISHPFLGKLALADGLRFLTQHIGHHQGQIVGAPKPSGLP